MKNKNEENETNDETEESNTKDELWKRYYDYLKFVNHLLMIITLN